MCGSKKVVVPETKTNTIQNVVTPTSADASVTKTSDTQRRKIAGLGARNIRTSSRGIQEDAKTNKRKLLGE